MFQDDKLIQEFVVEIASLLAEVEGQPLQIEPAGADIEDALAKGRSGTNTKMEVERGLPKQYLSKYFSPASGGYKITDSIHRFHDLWHPVCHRRRQYGDRQAENHCGMTRKLVKTPDNSLASASC